MITFDKTARSTPGGRKAGESRSAEHVIRLENLTKDYDRLRAVDDLSLEIRGGEILGFLGPNGAGKTTTINMICGTARPSAGQVRFSGGDLKGHLGLCPQENVYWPKLTCTEQLVFMGEMYGMPRRRAQKRAAELLERLGLSEKARVLAARLSGGMKRRLNLCLGLIHDPKILILDEPEAGLDPQSRILVREFIRSLAKQKTVVLTTHNMDEADRLSDRVAIIDRGRLLLLETPANLKRSIGEGDILEITLRNPAKHLPQTAAEALSALTRRIQVRDKTLILKSKDMIQSLPAITQVLEKAGLGIAGITMRENTLEDVFIHLTGKNLRE